MSKALEHLKIRLLPPEIINCGFVKNLDICNYELFLVDFLNSSQFFLEKVDNAKFVYQSDQSNGECDCYATTSKGLYGIDFKLFTSQKGLEANSVLSLQRKRIAVGAYSTSVARGSKSVKYPSPESILRGKSLENLEQIKQAKNAYNGDGLIGQEIRSILNTFETKKNLLLFYTFHLFFPKNVEFDFNEEAEVIVSDLSDWLNGAFAYRNKYAPGFETYFSFIFDDQFVITQIQSNHLVLLEHMSISKSKIFMELNDLLLVPRKIELKV